jgi:hypothetical protein
VATNKLIEQRRQVRCAKCGDDFSYIIRVTPEQLQQPELIVNTTCPFCGAKLRVDISPWRRRVVTSYKALGESDLQDEWELAELPAELSSQQQDE